MLLNTSKSTKYDVKIAMLLFTILVTSSITGQNFINVFGHNIATGMLIFPLTFMLVASSTELYGFRYTRSIIWTAALCNIFMTLLIILFTTIPSSRSYVGDTQIYHKFCQRLTHLILMSTFAYLTSEFANAWIISKLSTILSGKFLLRRAFISTSVAITIDTWLFFPIIASRQNSLGVAVTETFIDMLIKIGYELLLLPLFWIFVEYVRRQEDRLSNTEQLPECAAPFSSIYYLKSESDPHIQGT